MKIKYILCLILPIAAAFAGCFAAVPVWNYFSPEKTAPELFKFGAAALLFIVVSGIEFILTRKNNPVIKIGISGSSSGEDAPSQVN